MWQRECVWPIRFFLTGLCEHEKQRGGVIHLMAAARRALDLRREGYLFLALKIHSKRLVQKVGALEPPEARFVEIWMEGLQFGWLGPWLLARVETQ